jgi:hypothetical protein
MSGELIIDEDQGYRERGVRCPERVTASCRPCHMVFPYFHAPLNQYAHVCAECNDIQPTNPNHLDKQSLTSTGSTATIPSSDSPTHYTVPGV